VLDAELAGAARGVVRVAGLVGDVVGGHDGDGTRTAL
jgi:hypothetical protein